ncbi:hypothetical protein PBRA_000870, partial [Plasmodiophora brassicae]
GQPNCLAGKRFVISGTLPTLERDECQDLIKRYGGMVTTQVSGRTTHLLTGTEPGEKKLAGATERNIAIIDEDALFAMIATGKAQSEPMKKQTNVKLSTPTASSSLMWVDKYKPVKSSDLCANPGAIQQLKKFLTHWPHTEGGKRAVLLSGPPGIGKSSAASICAQEAGFRVIELNASTTRSRRALEEHVKELFQTHSISEYFMTDRKNVSDLKKSVLVMDEVDGMSGGDRGGMQELYAFIKTTKIPIICVCNDRASPKVRTLANYCLDLRFRRPTATQVEGRLRAIAKAEGLNIDAPTLHKISELSHGDIRQMLNTLQLFRTRSSSVSFDDAQHAELKDFDSSPFERVPELFRPVANAKSDWLSDRMDVYFVDSSLVPLMVQHSYVSAMPQLSPSEMSRPESERELIYLEHFAHASSYISDGDLIGSRIRSTQSWSMMPAHAVLSCVAPAFCVSGRLSGRPPGVLRRPRRSVLIRLIRNGRVPSMAWKEFDKKQESSSP